MKLLVGTMPTMLLTLIPKPGSEPKKPDDCPVGKTNTPPSEPARS